MVPTTSKLIVSVPLAATSLMGLPLPFEIYNLILKVGKPRAFYLIDCFKLLSNVMIFEWW